MQWTMIKKDVCLTFDNLKGWVAPTVEVKPGGKIGWSVFSGYGKNPTFKVMIRPGLFKKYFDQSGSSTFEISPTNPQERSIKADAPLPLGFKKIRYTIVKVDTDEEVPGDSKAQEEEDDECEEEEGGEEGQVMLATSTPVIIVKTGTDTPAKRLLAFLVLLFSILTLDFWLRRK